ncbi:hypothetical protein [Sphingomonas elodea]|uniref:hypothetical protein n=1 Tax=Sphingomonas elodea TaxID=179878 RepID=UPI0002632187|nr:hypothetical protein [Sphingomonas elodea]
MADKKAKQAKKDGKTPSLLPKVIGGIKLPKDARRQLTALAKHPVIADLLAAGLVALADRIKGEASKPAPAPEPTPAPAEPQPAAAPATKPVVKRIRKPAAKPSEPVAEPAAAAKPAKAPPPRRTRKASDVAPKPRTRRTPPKTDG